MSTILTRTALDAATVYRPQQDSHLLLRALREAVPVAGRRALDLCSGGGVIALAAAGLGAATVTGLDICPRAVHYARTRASVAGARVDIRLGSWTQALDGAPFDVVACNPPCLPTRPVRGHVAPAGAWGAPSTPVNGGPDGRLMLEPLCEVAADMLTGGGTLLLVQTELADIARSLRQLSDSGLEARVVLSERVQFGPALSEQAVWLEQTGRLAVGRRHHRIAVIQADKPV